LQAALALLVLINTIYIINSIDIAYKWTCGGFSQSLAEAGAKALEKYQPI
jgi:hypothetical protein